jgi:flagellar hook-associated protein 2
MTDIGSTAPVSFTGIESGLNTEQIMSAYLQIDEAPLTQLENQQTTVNNQVSAYQAIEQQLQALQTAADQVSGPDAFASAVQATSSDSSAATATTTTGATTGSTTFTVDNLAEADTLVSSGTVASVNDAVASGNLLLASGGSGLGIASVSGAGLSSGAHTIAVTQASGGASIAGTTTIGDSTQITSANDVLSVSIDGSASSFTIANGTYTANQLASAVETASGGLLTAATNNSGQLELTTAEQGSQATLQVGSGSANATLGLTASGTVSGTDGIITVDGQANTVSDIAAAGSTPVTLTSGTGGTVQASLASGGLSLGTMTAQNISVGSGSLASIVSAVNACGLNMSAEALNVGENKYALSISSDKTGAANDVTIDPSAFSGSGLGSLVTTTAGQNAVISLGGTGGYQVSSASNTLTGVMPGVSINLQSVTSSPVTVSVTADGQAASNLVQSFVSAANTVLQSIATDTAYNQTTNTAGTLNGDVQLQGLAQQILAVVGQAIGTSTAADSGTAGSAAGLSLDAKTGQIAFNATTFATDFENSPSAVTKLFTQQGSFTPASGSPAGDGDVSLIYANDNTVPGSYGVVVSQSAAQANDTGTASFTSSAATVSSPETYTVSSGGETANYAITGGESLAQIASGLDGAFAQDGLGLSAQVVSNTTGSSLQITSADYGSASSFSVSSSGSDQLGLVGSSFVGTDVEGTINGVTALGDGQVLSAPTTDPTLAGLSMLVTTPGITSSSTLGTFDYQAGLAGGLANLMASAAASTNGEVPAKITSLQNNSKQLGMQITTEQQIVVEQQQQLEAEFNNLESTLSTLNAQSSYLTSLYGTSSDSLGSLTGDSSSSSNSSDSTSST